MKTVSTRWVKLVAALSASLALIACVEINGKAEVSDKGHVKVVTSYDFSKVFSNIKEQNPALSERMEGFDCKIFVSTSPNFKCSDEGMLKYKMSDEQDKPVGVSFNEATQELNFDAVKYFANVTDLKSMVQRNSAQGTLISSEVSALLPLQSARREMYAKEGLSIILNLKFASEIVSIDGQEVKNKGRELTINFMDIADKPSYVIVTRTKKSFGFSWLMPLLVLVLLGLAVWFLWRKRNGGSNTPSSTNSAPNSPTSPTDQVATGVPTTQATKSHGRFAQAISAAAVGMGSAAVGGGANHSVEAMLANEEPVVNEPPKDYDVNAVDEEIASLAVNNAPKDSAV